MFHDMFFSGSDPNQLSGCPREQLSWLTSPEDAESRLFNTIQDGTKGTFCSAHSLLHIAVYSCTYPIPNFVSTDGQYLEMSSLSQALNAFVSFSQQSSIKHNTEDQMCPTKYYCSHSAEMSWVELHEVAELPAFLVPKPARSYCVTLLTRLVFNTHCGWFDSTHEPSRKQTLL